MGKSIVDYLRSSISDVDEVRKRVLDELNYKVIKEKYPKVFKEALKLQKEYFVEALHYMASFEVKGYHPLLDEAVEKEDFGKFYDEVILSIVPDKTPWSGIYHDDAGFGPLLSEKVNPLPEFGLVNEDKFEYIFKEYKVCIGRGYSKIGDDGSFIASDIAQDYDIVTYLRLIHSIYKGSDLAPKEAIKILQEHGFLSGYSLEELKE